MHLQVSMTNFQRNYIDLAKLGLDWTSAGIDRLEELVDSFLVTEPCEVVTSMKREGEDAHFLCMLYIHQQPPPSIRFATGDVIHNLRATLDSLVWGIGSVEFETDAVVRLEDWSGSTFRDRYLPKISRLPDYIGDWMTSAQP